MELPIEMTKSNYQNSVSIVGGLGNQLFQYAFVKSNHPNEVLILSKEFRPDSRQSGSKLDLADFSIENCAIQSGKSKYHFCKLLFHNLILRVSSTAETRKWYKKLGISVQLIAKTLLESIYSFDLKIECQSSIGYNKNFIVKSRKNTLQIGYFQHCLWKNYNQVTSHLHSLKLVNPSKYFYELLSYIENRKILIVHCRFGDFMNEKNFGVPSGLYFERAINYHLGECEYDEIIVFTNERSKLEIRFNPNILVKIIDENTLLRPSEILELMRHGAGYVISNSTFSWWGAFLSKTSNPMVVCPTPWFTGLSEPEGLIPNHWIKMAGQYQDTDS